MSRCPSGAPATIIKAKDSATQKKEKEGFLPPPTFCNEIAKFIEIATMIT